MLLSFCFSSITHDVPGRELESASLDCGREKLCELALCGDSMPSTRRFAACRERIPSFSIGVQHETRIPWPSLNVFRQIRFKCSFFPGFLGS